MPLGKMCDALETSDAPHFTRAEGGSTAPRWYGIGVHVGKTMASMGIPYGQERRIDEPAWIVNHELIPGTEDTEILEAANHVQVDMQPCEKFSWADAMACGYYQSGIQAAMISDISGLWRIRELRPVWIKGGEVDSMVMIKTFVEFCETQGALPLLGALPLTLPVWGKMSQLPKIVTVAIDARYVCPVRMKEGEMREEREQGINFIFRWSAAEWYLAYREAIMEPVIIEADEKVLEEDTGATAGQLDSDGGERPTGNVWASSDPEGRRTKWQRMQYGG